MDRRESSSTSESRRQKLFVGGLHRDTTDDTLKAYFVKYGDLTDTVVIRDSTTKESRGFGYVTFADHLVTKKVLADKRNDGPHTIDGKEVEVKRAIPRDDNASSSHNKTKKVFIGGIPESANDEDIKEAVCNALEGEVVKIDLIKKKTEDGVEASGHRGFCFVELHNEDDADELCCIKRVELKGKFVDMKKAEPKGSDGGGGGGRGRGGRGGGYQGGRGRSSGGYSGSSGYGSGGYSAPSYSDGSGYGYSDGYNYGSAAGYGYGGSSGGGSSGYYDSNYGDMTGMYGQSSYYASGGGAGGAGGRGRGSRYRPY